jgi:hypothetical protein
MAPALQLPHPTSADRGTFSPGVRASWHLWGIPLDLDSNSSACSGFLLEALPRTADAELGLPAACIRVSVRVSSSWTLPAPEGDIQTLFTTASGYRFAEVAGEPTTLYDQVGWGAPPRGGATG